MTLAEKTHVLEAGDARGPAHEAEVAGNDSVVSLDAVHIR
jgi:hypothetical protein